MATVPTMHRDTEAVAESMMAATADAEPNHLHATQEMPPMIASFPNPVLMQLGSGQYEFLVELTSLTTQERIWASAWVDVPSKSELEKLAPAGHVVSDWKLVVIPF